MTDEDFYRRVGNLDLLPTGVPGVWRTRDDQERRSVSIQSELAEMDDDVREAFLRTLARSLGRD